METVYDDQGCSSEGYKFDMAFITRGQENPNAEFIDDFSIFFNVTTTCGSDNNDPTNGSGTNDSGANDNNSDVSFPSECYSATIVGQDRPQY